jgi:hypothetical protein
VFSGAPVVSHSLRGKVDCEDAATVKETEEIRHE